MKPRVLWVDDDPHIIAGTRRYLRRDFDLSAAYDAAEGLKRIESEGPFAVIISDLRMPGVDGIEFLSCASRVAPETVRIMLTGYAEQQTAIDAVNRGQIFRFLTKPSEPETVQAALTAAVEQYRLVQAERELLEETLVGSIRIMTDLLALTNPLAFTHVQAVRDTALKVARLKGLSDLWRLEAAVTFAQIGFVTVPPATLENYLRGRDLNDQETAMIAEHPRITRDLLQRIPRLEEVGTIIDWLSKAPSKADCERSPDLALAASILRAASTLDRIQALGRSRQDALAYLAHHPTKFDPEIVDALTRIGVSQGKAEPARIYIDALKNGMILDEEVKTHEGVLLVPKGLTVNDTIRQRLRNFRLQDHIGEKLFVLIPPNL